MAAITVRVADPTARVAISSVVEVFRLFPAPVTIVVTMDADAVVAIGIAALEGASYRGSGHKYHPSHAQHRRT
jgi:hypothetical protein